MEIKVNTGEASRQDKSVSSDPSPSAAMDVITPAAAVETPVVPPGLAVAEPQVSVAPPVPDPVSSGPAPNPGNVNFGPEDSDGVPPPPAVTAIPKKKKPVLVILLAILVALLLAGVVIFAYLKGSKKTNLPAKAPASSNQLAPALSSTDVSSAIKYVDSSLNTVNDSKDFSSTDLSDQALGL